MNARRDLPLAALALVAACGAPHEPPSDPALTAHSWMQAPAQGSFHIVDGVGRELELVDALLHALSSLGDY